MDDFSVRFFKSITTIFHQQYILFFGSEIAAYYFFQFKWMDISIMNYCDGEVKMPKNLPFV